MPAIPIAVYGPSGIGKTADITRCFRNAYYLMYDFDGLASCRTLWEYEPAHHSMNNLDDPAKEAEQAIKQLAPAVRAGKVTSIVIDTGTELALRIFSVVDAKYNGNAPQVYPAIKREFTTIIRSVLNLNIPVVVIFQEQKPRKATGGKLPLAAKMGGPQVPGTTLDDLRPMFSEIIRADYIVGANGRQRCYICDPLDAQWVTKDRYNVFQDTVVPMDIRPIMAAIFAKAKTGR
jgi:hypothetical protein